jgi:hypothetical protein
VLEKPPEVVELICTTFVLSFVITMECVLAGANARDQFVESSHSPLPALIQLLVCAGTLAGKAIALKATVAPVISRRTIETDCLIDFIPYLAEFQTRS